MKITHGIIFIIGILSIFGISYLAYTGEIYYKPGNVVRYFIGGCRNNNDRCDILEVCKNDKCVDPCFKIKCGLHEWCQKTHHNFMCSCLPGFIRNSTTNICDIKGCRTNEDCGPGGECDINYSECQCDSNFIWDSVSKSCVQIKLQIETISLKKKTNNNNLKQYVNSCV